MWDQKKEKTGMGGRADDRVKTRAWVGHTEQRSWRSTHHSAKAPKVSGATAQAVGEAGSTVTENIPGELPPPRVGDGQLGQWQEGDKEALCL